MTDELYVIYQKTFTGRITTTLRRMKPGDAINVPIPKAKVWYDTAYKLGLKARQQISRSAGYTTIYIVSNDAADDDEAPE